MSVAPERIRCPHCGNNIRLLEQAPDHSCVACGSSFLVDPDATRVQPRRDDRTFGRFDVQEELGRGAFGVVYRAIDTTLQRAVALKVPRSGTFASRMEEERFVREAQHAARLQHPNIVSVHEVGTPSSPYIVSEYIQGITLDDRLSGGRLSFRETAQVVVKVAGALDYAHENGVIHRDVKPSNILLDNKDQPHLTDFGLARETEPEITMTRDGEIIGTPAYMSPEQAAGEHRNVDRRSDVYSVGVMLYRMLCGELPFRGSQRMLLHQVINEDPKPPRRINHVVPRDLETIALKAMEKQRESRYQSAKEIADDLSRWLVGDPIRARPPGTIEKLVKCCRKRPVVSSLVATCATLLMAIAVGSLVWANRESKLRADTQDAKKSSEEFLNQSLMQQCDAAESRYSSPLSGLPYLVAASSVLKSLDNEEGVDLARSRISQSVRAASGLRRVYALGSHIDGITTHEATGSVFIASGTDIVRFSIDDYSEISRLKNAIRCKELVINYSGTRLVALPHPIGNTGILNARADSTRNRMALWNPQTKEIVSQLDHDEIITDAVFSPNGKHVATCGLDGVAKVWSAETGELEQTLEQDVKIVPLVEFTSDSKYLIVVAEAARSVTAARPRIYDTTDWEYEEGPNTFQTRHITLNGSDNYFAAGYGGIQSWSVPGAVPEGPAFTLPGSVTRVFTLPDEKLLSFTDAQEVGFWDYSGNRLRADILDGRGERQCIDVAPDGSFYAVSGTEDLCHVRWCASGDPVTVPLTHGVPVCAIAVAPDSRTVIAGCMDGTVRVWDLATTVRAADQLRLTAIPESAGIASDSNYVAVGLPEAVEVWDANAQRRVYSLAARLGDVAFNEDGRLIAITEASGVKVVDVATGKIMHQFLPDRVETVTTTVAWALDGRTLAIGYSDGLIDVWGLSAEPKRLLTVRHSGAVGTIAFDSKVTRIAAAADDGLVVVWDLEGHPLSPPLTRRGKINSLEFSSTGDRLLVASRPWVLLWAIPQGQLHIHRKPSEQSNAVFANEGKHFFAPVPDGRLGYWTTSDTPVLQRTFSDLALQKIQLHKTKPIAMTTSRRRHAKFWHTLNGYNVLSQIFTAEASFIEMSASGDKVLTAGRSKVVSLWKLSSLRYDDDVLQKVAMVLTRRRYEDGVVDLFDSSELTQLVENLTSTCPELFQASALEVEEWSARKAARLD